MDLFCLNKKTDITKEIMPLETVFNIKLSVSVCFEYYEPILTSLHYYFVHPSTCMNTDIERPVRHLEALPYMHTPMPNPSTTAHTSLTRMGITVEGELEKHGAQVHVPESSQLL